MKKIFMAVVAAACMLSVSALSLGLRGDVDFGFGKLESVEDENGATTLKPALDKSNPISSGSVSAWVDLPLINLGLVSVGLRPEAEVAVGKGFAVKDENGGNSYTLNQTTLTVPLFLDACVNLGSLRVSAGVGPYAVMPLAFSGTDEKLGDQEIQKPEPGFDSLSWGIAGYVQGGFKLGPGYLLADARVSAPMTTQELKTVAKAGEESKTALATKTYKVGVGLGYEFKF